MKCPVYEMSYLWNVPCMKCPKAIFIAYVFLEVSQSPHSNAGAPTNFVRWKFEIHLSRIIHQFLLNDSAKVNLMPVLQQIL